LPQGYQESSLWDAPRTEISHFELDGAYERNSLCVAIFVDVI
jgi:hypothetical protein